MDDERNPWDRLEGEPPSWHRRFIELYLSQVGGRSLLAAFNAEQDKKGQKRTPNVPRNWREAAERWRWKDRAEQCDIEQSRQSLKAWELRQAEWRERMWDMASRLAEKAAQMMQFPLAKVKKEEGDKTTIIEPADWRMADAAKIVETADKLARLSAGMETDKRTVEFVWQTEVIDLIRGKKVTFEDVAEEYGSDLAEELFKSAGVPVGQGGEVEAEGGEA